MGYWEQVGESNILARKRDEAMHPTLRAARDVLGTALVIVVSLLIWALILAPLVLPLFR